MLVKETQLKVLLQIYRKIDIVWGNRAVTSPKDSRMRAEEYRHRRRYRLNAKDNIEEVYGIEIPMIDNLLKFDVTSNTIFLFGKWVILDIFGIAIPKRK